MRIADLTAIHARIPLKRQVRHASHVRSDNDAFLVRCTLSDGTVGWGEGLPRLYVTGETIDTAWMQFGVCDFAALSAPFQTLPETLELLDGLAPPAAPLGERACFGNAFRCAIELSVLDAACRSLGRPLSDVTAACAESAPFRADHEQVQYSAAISSTSLPKALAAAAVYRFYKFRFCKLKVGAQRGDALLLRCVRGIAGAGMDLRVDANEGWRPEDVERCIARLRPAGITAVEQPVAHRDVGCLRALRPRLGVPIVLDESLCSPADARRSIDEQLCDIFNIRLSKCGGYVASLRLAAIARSAGLEFQLGCQVGETGILSAAGRHWACSVATPRYLEGSFDRILVTEPLIREDITFRRGGWAKRLPGPGLGITMDDAAIARVTARSESRALN